MNTVVHFDNLVHENRLLRECLRKIAVPSLRIAATMARGHGQEAEAMQFDKEARICQTRLFCVEKEGRP